MRAMVVDQPGPPEVLQLRELPEPQPGPGQTTRDVLEQLRENANCAGCHAVIDPIGLAPLFFALARNQTRAQQLMRDMTRHLRNQDISTGKPKK